MKKTLHKFILTALAIALPTIANAQFSEDGYYRVESVEIGQTLYIKSGKAQDINYSTGTSINIANIRGLLDKTAKYSTPSTIINISKYIPLQGINGETRVELGAQGVTTKNITGVDAKLFLVATKTKDVYKAAAEYKSGRTYLRAIESKDEIKEEHQDGEVITGADDEYSTFKITKVDESSNYFGIKPRVELDGAYYDPFYVAFPYSFSSTGMKAFKVDKISEVKDGKAYVIYSEVNASGIAPGTPLIVKCSSNKPENNKLKINGVTGQTISYNGNFKGAYRSCPEPEDIRDVVTYDKYTMRILGTDNGKLVFKKSSTKKYIDENEAYLVVGKNYPDVLELVTQSEYDNITGIDDITVYEVSVNPRVKGVYTIAGVRVADTKDFDKLPSGVYIVDGKQRTK